MRMYLAVLLLLSAVSSASDERIASDKLQEKGIHSYVFHSMSPQAADLDLLDRSKIRVLRLKLKVDPAESAVHMNIIQDGKPDIRVTWDSSKGVLEVSSAEDNAVLRFDREKNAWINEGSAVLVEETGTVLQIAAGVLVDLTAHGVLPEPKRKAPQLLSESWASPVAKEK